MKLELEIRGNTHTVDVSLDTLTLQEAVQVEALIGGAAWDEYLQGRRRPSAVRAVLQAKLARLFPDLDPDDFDLPFLEFGVDTTAGEDQEDTDPTGGD